MLYTVKQKIRWGTVFLFLLLMLLGGVSIFHILRLQKDSKIILKNNYESLDYCHQMLGSLDSIHYNTVFYKQQFEKALRGQEINITEKGEKEATKAIRYYFDRFNEGNQSDTIIQHIRNSLQKVLLLNMSAIDAKNNNAGNTAEKAVTYITLIAAVIFLIGLTFTFNFPSVITAPINVLISGIKQVAAKNYSYRIHLDQKDEFGQMAVAFNTMAERLEYFENSNLNQIIFEKKRAEAVINTLRDASIGIDKNNIILFANNHALLLLGLKAGDIVAKNVEEVSRKNDLFRFLLEEKSSMPFKVVVENRENYFIKEVMEIDEDGESGKLIVLKNITSFKELDVAKNNFIATISHELKTPLASSDFSLKLLQDERIGKLSGEQNELVENLKQDNQRMLRILSELLNISQVESGKMQLEIANVSSKRIADNAIDTVANAAKEKDIKIIRQYGEQDIQVEADAEKTSWVLNNFLTNAIKHSHRHSTIILTIDNSGEEISFSVKDEGPGIAAEYLPKVFDRFFKVPGSGTPGSGLGLTISREFIEAQGGRIWVESTIGSGSCFGFNLPLK